MITQQIVLFKDSVYQISTLHGATRNRPLQKMPTAPLEIGDEVFLVFSSTMTWHTMMASWSGVMQLVDDPACCVPLLRWESQLNCRKIMRQRHSDYACKCQEMLAEELAHLDS